MTTSVQHLALRLPDLSTLPLAAIRGSRVPGRLQPEFSGCWKAFAKSNERGHCLGGFNAISNLAGKNLNYPSSNQFHDRRSFVSIITVWQDGPNGIHRTDVLGISKDWNKAFPCLNELMKVRLRGMLNHAPVQIRLQFLRNFRFIAYVRRMDCMDHMS